MLHSAPARLTWFDRSDRTRLEISGPDRAKFLHNLTTNDVKKLAEGTGHEAFVTSPQGKTLAYVTLLASDRAILLRTDRGDADLLQPHLQKYGVFDEVVIADVSPSTFEYHLTGPEVDSVITRMGIDVAAMEKPLRHSEVDLAGHPVRLIRENLLGEPGWTWVGSLDHASDVVQKFGEQAVERGDGATFEMRRIEAGTPASGRDVQPNNLPQEVGRDQRTINFVKGCYLGQETVARLDALGHVNRIFRGGWIEGTTAVPPAGTALLAEDGKPVGAITSATFSPTRNAPVWLGYVRVPQATAGTKLTIPPPVGTEQSPAVAVVSDFPLPR